MKNLTETTSAKDNNTSAKASKPKASKSNAKKEIAKVEGKKIEAQKPKGRLILGFQLKDKPESEVLDIITVLKGKELTKARIIEEIKKLRISRGTAKDCKFSNLETRVNRALTWTIETARNNPSRQSKLFNIDVQYTNVKVKENEGKFSLSINGKSPNIRQELI